MKLKLGVEIVLERDGERPTSAHVREHTQSDHKAGQFGESPRLVHVFAHAQLEEVSHRDRQPIFHAGFGLILITILTIILLNINLN